MRKQHNKTQSKQIKNIDLFPDEISDQDFLRTEIFVNYISLKNIKKEKYLPHNNLTVSQMEFLEIEETILDNNF